MSIAGGLFNSNNKQEGSGDTKSTADGEATGGMEQARDMTTSLPGFDDPGLDEDSIVLDTDSGSDTGTFTDNGSIGFDLDRHTGAGNQDVEGVTDEATLASFDVDAEPEVPLDPES